MNKNGIIKVAEGTETVSLKEFDYGETRRFYFPKSLKSISMIGKNIKAEYFDIDGENECFSSIDGVLYSKDRKTLVAVPNFYPGEEFTVPGFVEIINKYAFAGSHLKKVILSEGVRKIESNAFVGAEISGLVLPDSLEVICGDAFNSCYNLAKSDRSFRLPRGIKEIGACAIPFETGRIYVPVNVDKIKVYSDAGKSYFVMREKQENIYGIETVWEGSAETEMKIIKVSDKRQITIPKEFFEKLGMGDEAVCELTDGGIIIRPLDGVTAKMHDSEKNRRLIKDSFGD